MFGRSSEERAIEKGLDYQNSDNYEKAEREFKRAIEINSNYSDAYYYLGVLYKIQDKSELAISNYEKALEIDPSNSRARYMLKLLTNTEAVLSSSTTPFPARGKTTGAMMAPKVDYDKVKSDLIKDIKETYEKSLQHAKEGQFPEAINSLEKSIQLNPNNYKARYNLAVAYLHSGHPVKASMQLRQAIKINPQYQLAKEALDKITVKD